MPLASDRLLALGGVYTMRRLPALLVVNMDLATLCFFSSTENGCHTRSPLMQLVCLAVRFWRHRLCMSSNLSSVNYCLRVGSKQVIAGQFSHALRLCSPFCCPVTACWLRCDYCTTKFASRVAREAAKLLVGAVENDRLLFKLFKTQYLM